MKKYVVLVLAVIVLVSLQGCGRQAKEDPVEEADNIISEIEGTVTADQALTQAGQPVQTTVETLTSVTEEIDMTMEYEKPSTQAVQEALKNAGLYTGSVDGVLGPQTKRAIREFQSMNNLSADGKVGRKTWSKLKPYLVGVPAAPAAMPQ